MKKSIFLFFAAILCAIGMNAANYLYLKPSSDWKSSNARFAAYFFESGEKWVSMTKVTDDLYRVEIPSGYSKVIFCRMNGSNSTNNWDNKWNQTGNLTISGNTGKVYNIKGWGDGSSWGSTVPLYAKNTTLYILPNSDWKSDNARFAVCFLDGKENWVSCTKVGSTDYYSVTVPNSDLIAYAIFCRMNGNNATNNWSNKWNQTNDLAPSSGNNGVEITGWDNSQKWIVVYDQLSVDHTPTTAADAPNISQTLIKGGSSVTVTAPNAKTGYHWVKWTSSNGSFNDQSAQNTNFTPTAKSAVATANYAENTYTVTISASTGGTVSPLGDQTIGQVTKTTVTATANDNYEFANWTATGGVVVANTSAASTTITATAAGTLTANFRSTATYSLTVAEGAGIASVEGSTDPVTLGNTYEIKATPKTGYTFSTWTAEPAANATFADAASATTDVTVLNGSVTVTASAEEVLSTLTTANEYNEGTPTIAVPTASAPKIGVTTTATVTAAVGTGYTFAGWKLDNCVRTDAGADNATTITVKSNGDGADAKVTAKYEQNVVYFVNTKGWSTVKVYAWNDGGASNAAWSGVALTDANIVKQIGGCDVYKYVPGANYAKVIFNNGSEKTDDLAWQNGKYYVYNSENTKDVSDWYTEAEVEGVLPDPVQLTYTVEVPAGTHECYIAGDMNGWALTKMDPVDATHFTLTIQWATNAHEYKYACGPDWKYEEVKADGSSVSNRKYNATDVVARWNCAPGIHLVGDMNNWNTAANKFQISGTTATVTIALETGVYKFKVNNDGEWLGNNGTMVRGGDGMDTGWSFESDKDACQLTADIAGDYTFTWNLETKKLTVTYPALPKHQVTATVNPAETGEVTGTGEYEQGTEATLVATPAAGYAFKNWTVGGTEKSTEATYTFTVNEPISLVANFIPEVTHEVTVSYLCNSIPIPGHDATTLAVGVTTPSTITAPTIKNYKFDSWTLGTGLQSEDDSKNPIQITTKSEGDYTLAANYTKIELTYNVTVPAGTEKCFIRGAFDGWDKFHEMTKVDDTHYTITIEGATKDMEYKYACQESWDYVEKKADGNDLENNRKWSDNDVVAKWGKPIVVTYQLKGVGGWDQPGIELVQNPDKTSEYMLTCQAISATDAIKVVRLENGEIKDYYGNGTVKDGVEVSVSYDADANIKLPAGKYNFYFDTNESEKKLWIAAATDCVTEPETPAVIGKFSTGKYEYAEFALGNLQYNVGTDTWAFAANQYDVIGEDNINLGDPTFTGTIDMFGWSTDDADNNYGVNPNNVNELYDGTFQDWGTKMGEGWETLSADQWKYLLNTRPNAASLKQIARVGEVVGIMLFPDNWNAPLTVTAQHDSYFDVDIHNYTLEQWAALENAGALFLPAAGRRAGGYGNMINKDQVEETNSANLNGGHYKHQDNTNIYCYYWTRTINESTKDVSYLHNIHALGGDKYTIGTGAIWGEKGRYGQSVRLAKVTSTLVKIGDSGNTAVIEANNGKEVDVQVNRTFTADKLHTLCLPFDAPVEILGVGSKAYQLSGVRSLADGSLVVDVTLCSEMKAGAPYLVIPTNTFALGELIVDNVTMKNVDVTTVNNVVNNGETSVVFQGILDANGQTNGSTHYYIGTNSYLYNGTVDILGLRSMFIITGMPAGMRARVAFGENAATGLDNITNGENTTIKVIENGQLVIIRNGEKFNAQGVRF